MNREREERGSALPCFRLRPLTIDGTPMGCLAGGHRPSDHLCCLLECKGPELARRVGSRSGRARQLCPGSSDVDYLRDLDRVIYLDTEVANGAFDLGVAEKQLNGT
jgi:hypothetical protein